MSGEEKRIKTERRLDRKKRAGKRGRKEEEKPEERGGRKRKENPIGKEKEKCQTFLKIS